VTAAASCAVEEISRAIQTARMRRLNRLLLLFLQSTLHCKAWTTKYVERRLTIGNVVEKQPFSASELETTLMSSTSCSKTWDSPRIADTHLPNGSSSRRQEALCHLLHLYARLASLHRLPPISWHLK
jgi:hypothetical protein